MTDSTDRQTLSRELEGLEGLVFRIANMQVAGSLRAAALSLVCEAIYLARQVIANDNVGGRDVANLQSATDQLVNLGRTAQVNAVKGQVWPLLPEGLQAADGTARKGLDFALHTWLSSQDVDGQEPGYLAGKFVEFVEREPEPAKLVRPSAQAADDSATTESASAEGDESA